MYSRSNVFKSGRLCDNFRAYLPQIKQRGTRKKDGIEYVKPSRKVLEIMSNAVRSQKVGFVGYSGRSFSEANKTWFNKVYLNLFKKYLCL